MEVPEPVRASGAEYFDVDPSSFKSLGGEDGAVYLCRKGERAHVIKFVPIQPTRLGRFEKRLAFIDYLATNGVNLARPLPSKRGNIYERIEHDGQLYVATLTPKANGRTIEWRYPEWNTTLFEIWGRTIGKMHALAKRYPHWRREEPDSYVEAMTDDSPDDQIMDWRMEHASFERWCTDPVIVRAWLPLKEKLKALPITRDSYGLIHNDLHQWNFLYEKGNLTIIDFDVCGYNWFMIDIAIALYQAMLASVHNDRPADRLAFARSFLGAFWTGYNQENQLDSFWWKQLNTFLKYRQILVYIALSNSWAEDRRSGWQRIFLTRMHKGITSGKPVLPEEFVARLG